MSHQDTTRLRERLRTAAVYPIANVDGIDSAKAFRLAEAAAKAAIPYLQLRCKDLGTAAFVRLAQQLRATLEHSPVALLINDRIDIALLVGAAGVHLGQTDLAPAAARRMLGPTALLGISTHSEEQARIAEAAGADYIGFGPIFSTATKADSLEPRGLEGLHRVRAIVHLPIIAIGGIDEALAPSVLEAGADAVAMIGALGRSATPAEILRRLAALRQPHTASTSSA